MEELSDKSFRNAAKIIERIAGQNKESIKLHEEIRKATPRGAIIRTRLGATLEEIKLPKLSALKQ